MRLTSYLLFGACLCAPFFIGISTGATVEAPGQSREHITDWLVMIYIAADNSLDPYVDASLKQLLKIDSNDHVTIVVQVNRRGDHPTRRFLVKAGHMVQLEVSSPESKLDSANKETLAGFCIQTIKKFPARKLCLIISSHGCGYLDIAGARDTHALTLMADDAQRQPADESIDGLRVRSLCEDMTHNTVLKNNDIVDAFAMICRAARRTIDVVGFDACNMQMLEVGMLLAPYAKVLIGSQEYELADGWNYHKVLQPLGQSDPDAITWAKHVVACYCARRSKGGCRYTLSVVDLGQLSKLDTAIDQLSEILLRCLQAPDNRLLIAILRCCNSSRTCPRFLIAHYLDLGCFLRALRQDSATIDGIAQPTREDIQKALGYASNVLEALVIANTSERYITSPQGLSIYFPRGHVHESYRTSPFALNNKWGMFLDEYVKARETYLAQV